MHTSYPTTRRADTVDDYHGTQIPDPYSWLEDPDSDETKIWVKEQNKVTAEYLNKCTFKDKLNDQLTKMYNYPKYSVPTKRGDFYYFSKNTGLQNQSVMYVQDTLTSEPRVFLDPNLLSEDGTVALESTAFSESGKLFAYGLSRSGSDWVTVYVRDTTTGKDLEDKLEWVKFSDFSWTHDNAGFFYNRYPKPFQLSSSDQKAGSEVDSNKNQKVYYHRIGTSQEDDILVYADNTNPDLMFGYQVTHNGSYLLFYPQEGCKEEHELWFVSLPKTIEKDTKFKFTKLVTNSSSTWTYITNRGTKFWFKTNNDAPRGRIVTADITNFDGTNFTELIAQATTDVLDSACCVNNDKLVVFWMRDVKDVMEIRTLKDGSLIKEVDLPGPGTISGFSRKRGDAEMFYKFVSFLHPGTIFRYDFTNNTVEKFIDIKVDGFNPDNFTATQIFYKSKDGEKIPMFIITNKDVKMDGTTPFYLYGYGGFGISIQPQYMSLPLVLLNNLNVGIAIANIRGGSEYGKKWHDAGKLHNKQNCFDDFIAAAENLINNKYTCAKKLTICGGSNGGLLVSACANQRPDLFGCVISKVGVLDMLKFHKFTIGHAWRSDYGDPDVEEDFRYIIKYSPLHNVQKGNAYPAMLLCTADHDDRVSPLHSLKHISTLQHELGAEKYQIAPLLIRVECNAGHGRGKPTSKIIEEYVDTYAFIANSLKLEWTD